MRDRCGKEILIRVLPTLYDTRTKLARSVCRSCGISSANI